MRAGVFQSRSGIDPAANSRDLVDAVGQAAAQGADIVFTPEMGGVLDRDRARAAAHIVAEEADAVLTAVRDAAARHGVWVHLGSLAVRGGADGRLANRGFLIDGGGTIRARYDKMHLFDVDLGDGQSWRESEAYAPGAQAVVAETPWGGIGLSVCYDLRFPDLYRAPSDAGATILSVPSAFTVPTGEAHWHVLLRARAIEAGAFVIAAAQCGLHEDGRSTYGHSLVVGPWGGVLLDMGDTIGVAVVEIDPARVDQARTRIPALGHRRPVAAAQVAR